MAYVSDTIIQVWASERVLEARNTLNPAYPSDYAMLQGCGGQDHARISGIYTCITDISQNAKQQNGGTAPTIGATVPTTVYAKAKKVAEFNLGSINLEEGDITKGFNSVGMVAAYVHALFAMFVGLITGIGVTAGNLIIGKIRSADIPNEVCAIAKTARETLLKNCQPVFEMKKVNVPVYKDWEYSQNRVNTYRKFPDGRVAVTVLSISRKQYQPINNVEKRQDKPWTVFVASFRAFPVEQKNGTVSYNGASKADESTARIKLSDDQMFDFCHRIEHFEDIWEITSCCSLVQDGLRMKEENRNQK